MKNPITVAVVLLTVAACGQNADSPANTPLADESEVAAGGTHLYADALASATRLEGDYARDADRKPGEVLEFLGVAPGMRVLDMFSGGGYYSEIIARVVGSDGSVDAHTNQAYLGFVGDEFDRRHAEGRLPNVNLLWAENNELALEESAYDAIMLVLTFHDLFHINEEGGWPKIDPDRFLAELHKGLKPDGFIGLIDHNAASGAPPETGDSLHRIDPALVVSMMAAAGFVLEAQSDVLRNPNDDLTRIVFDPELRGKTDRFIMRFRKAG